MHNPLLRRDVTSWVQGVCELAASLAVVARARVVVVPAHQSEEETRRCEWERGCSQRVRFTICLRHKHLQSRVSSCGVSAGARLL